MTLTVETGAGVRQANSLVTVAFVTAYLTERQRETAWAALSTALQEAAAIAATDYFEKTFGGRVKGAREFTFEAVQAEGLIEFTDLPLDTETLTLGDQTYTFATALSSPAVANEVLIGANVTEMATNMAAAINATSGSEGTLYSTGTDQSRHATAEASAGVVSLEALADGAGGNDTTLSESATNVTLTAFAGGLDGGPQPLSFPRIGLYGYDGRTIRGVPLKAKQGIAEYAERARADTLDPDPDVDATLAAVRRKREKVGPIEEETEYEPGSHLMRVRKPYPAADRLFAEYLTSAGVVR